MSCKNNLIFYKLYYFVNFTIKSFLEIQAKLYATNFYFMSFVVGCLLNFFKHQLKYFYDKYLLIMFNNGKCIVIINKLYASYKQGTHRISNLANQQRKLQPNKNNVNNRFSVNC